MSVQSKMARGAAWMILFKWVERGLGLISTLILVRLLAPQDFGLVAMALSFIFMAELLTAFAFDIAIIHDQSAGVDHYNSAWTANLALGALIAVSMWVFSHPISIFYGEPDLVPLVRALALGPLLAGFQNIGIVAFRKELDFRKEFTFQICRKLIGFFVTIPLAFALNSYWALVFGTLAAKLGGTLLSYWVHPFRPNLCVKRLGSLLRFSRWMLLNNVVNFLKNRASDFFIGRISGPALLGTYNVSYEFASLPTNEVGMPINRALMPGFAKLQDDPQGIRQSFRTAVGLLALIAIPIGTGLFAIAPTMVPVVLGEIWMMAIPVMEILSISSSVLVFHGTIVILFIAIGQPREATKINFAYVIVLVIALSRLTGQFGAVGAAYSMLIATIVSTPLYLIRLRKFVGEPVMRFFVATIRPTIASLVMILAVRSTLPEYQMGLSAFNGIKTLIVAIGIGVVSYAFTLVALWGIFGKGEGAERLVLDKLRLRYDWVLHRIQQKVGK